MTPHSTAQDVATFFVAFCEHHGDPLTNLHVQKYLYFAQGWFLAFHGEPLFSDRLEAWVHGPVQPRQYQRFKDFGWAPIVVADLDEPSLPSTVVDHLKEVHRAYGRFSAWDLERMTHAQAPWIEARGGIPLDASSNSVISTESMRRYFNGRLEEAQEQD